MRVRVRVGVRVRLRVRLRLRIRVRGRARFRARARIRVRVYPCVANQLWLRDVSGLCVRLVKIAVVVVGLDAVFNNLGIDDTVVMIMLEVLHATAHRARMGGGMHNWHICLTLC